MIISSSLRFKILAHSLILSVPLLCVVDVSIASIACFLQIDITISSSVATTTLSKCSTAFAVLTTIGRPPISAKTFCGNLVDASLAGIIIII